MKRGYAPYEQYRTEGTQGPWTDVYACAATLYRCLTGYKPPEAAGRLLDDELVSPDELVPSLSAQTNAAIRKGLSVQPEARPQSVDALASLLPDPPSDRAPGWVGTGSTLDVSLSTTGKESELRVRTSHPCRLYVDGDATGEFEPGESYTLGVEPGTHRLRAVRTDQTSERSVTVTAEGAGAEADDHHVSLEALVWQDVVSTSRDEPTDTDIDFATVGMGGEGEEGEQTVRLD
jgi:serine/threonine protein kinase